MNRGYTIPVFHTEHADDEQLKVLQCVFETLLLSGITFVIIGRSEDREKALELVVIGDGDDVDKEEILSICQEVAEMYKDGNEFTSITAEF